MPLVKGKRNRLTAKEPAAEFSDDCSWEQPIHPPVRWWSKSVFDRSVAFVGIVLTAPLMGILVLLVQRTSKGPAIYSQLRIGYQGKLFYLYKFRSMYQDCEKKTGPVWAAQNDARVTPMGKFLRKSYLDELPQLFNVLFGQMSLVGPRPERPEIAAKLRSVFPDDYYKRLLVPPGITGLAQIRLPADLDIDDVLRKVHYDLLYIRRMSLWLDIKLILGTVVRIVTRSPETEREARRQEANKKAAPGSSTARNPRPKERLNGVAHTLSHNPLAPRAQSGN